MKNYISVAKENEFVKEESPISREDAEEYLKSVFIHNAIDRYLERHDGKLPFGLTLEEAVDTAWDYFYNKTDWEWFYDGMEEVVENAMRAY